MINNKASCICAPGNISRRAARMYCAKRSLSSCTLHEGCRVGTRSTPVIQQKKSHSRGWWLKPGAGCPGLGDRVRGSSRCRARHVPGDALLDAPSVGLGWLPAVRVPRLTSGTYLATMNGESHYPLLTLQPRRTTWNQAIRTCKVKTSKIKVSKARTNRVNARIRIASGIKIRISRIGIWIWLKARVRISASKLVVKTIKAVNSGGANKAILEAMTNWALRRSTLHSNRMARVVGRVSRKKTVIAALVTTTPCDARCPGLCPLGHFTVASAWIHPARQRKSSLQTSAIGSLRRDFFLQQHVHAENRAAAEGLRFPSGEVDDC